jgi:hypothetical protein
MLKSSRSGLLLLLAVTAPAMADEAADIAALKARVSALEEQVASMPGQSDAHGGHFLGAGLPLHGFISVGASESTGNDPQRLRGFELDNIDLYLTPGIGQRVRGLVEMNFEVDHSGQVTTDLERLQLGYNFSGDNTLWLGRFHVPFGYWNTAHHHGAELQTSINRPRLIDFEDKGGILPAHAVGLWYIGKLPAGSNEIGYNAWLANGGRIQTTSDNSNVLDFNQFTDNDQHKMAGFSAAWMTNGDFDGLQVGVHAYVDRVQTYAPDNVTVLSQTDVHMTGAFVYYGGESLEVNGEYYHFDDDTTLAAGAAQPGNHLSDAGFLQVAYTFGKYTPFVRGESASLDSRDAYFSSMSSGVPYTREAVGVKYQLNPKASLKLEVGHTQEGRCELLDTSGLVPATRTLPAVSYNRVQAQAAIAF